MKVINLGEGNTILNKFVAQMRDQKVQKDSMRFRRNLERLGEIFAYEISKTLEYSQKPVTTPLGIANMMKDLRLYFENDVRFLHQFDSAL